MLNEGAEVLFLPALARHLHSGEGGTYFLAQQVEPNGAYLHMTLATDGDTSNTRGLELQIPHHTVRYIVAAQNLSNIGF